MKSVNANDATNTEEKLDELKRNIRQASTEIDNGQEFTRFCYNCIKHAFAKEEALDPRNPDRTRGQDTFCHFLYLRFREKHLEDFGIRLLEQIWHELQMIQKNENILTYDLDAVAATLSEAFYAIGDESAATRWALNLVASEAFCYGGRSTPERARILQWYGVPLEAINRLEYIASNNRRVVADAASYSIPEAFPEDSVTKFLADYQENEFLFAHHTPKFNEFPLSTVYFGSLMDRMERAEPPVDKGKTLEDLATYLTLLIPGWMPRRNVKTVYNEFESDIIISNLIQGGNFTADLFGRHILVECKNWCASVGTQEVGNFLDRMRSTDTRFGILFASSGITGDRKKSDVRNAAASRIHSTWRSDKIICIVIDAKDLKILKDGGSVSFLSMIRNKAYEVQFGKSSYSP